MTWICVFFLAVRDIKLFKVCSSLAYIYYGSTSVSTCILFSWSEFRSKSKNCGQRWHNFPIRVEPTEKKSLGKGIGFISCDQKRVQVGKQKEGFAKLLPDLMCLGRVFVSTLFLSYTPLSKSRNYGAFWQKFSVHLVPRIFRAHTFCRI